MRTTTERSGPAVWIAALAIVLVGALAYANGFDGRFVFDDHGDIVDNAAIRSVWPLWRVVLEQGQSGVSGRPLVALSYALNYAFDPPAPGAELDPASWHVVNVAIHLVAALFLFGCVRRALSNVPFEQRWGRSATGLALAVALIWVAHPLATGVIMYRGQRVEAMMAACFAATFYFALRAFEEPEKRRWARLAILSCALGSACKEVIVAAPLVVWTYDALFVAGSWSGALRQRRGLYAGLFASWLLIGLWVALAGGRSESVGFAYGHVGVWSYLTTQAWALPRYLRLALWPHPLVFDYGVQPVTEVASWLPRGFLVLALLAATAWGLARKRAWAFLGAWWFLILAPTSSFLPIVTELVVEHRAYLPTAAVVLLVVLVAHELLARALGARSMWVGAVLAVAATATGVVLTRARNRAYATELGLWADTVAKLPSNARAHASYANDLRVAGRVAEAGEHYEEAVKLTPDDPYWRANLGTWYLDQGRIDDALRELERSRELRPSYGMTLQNLGVAYSRKADGERAAEVWSQALEPKSDPIDRPPAPAFLAQQLSGWYLPRGKEREAIEAFRRAAQMGPNDPDLLLTLARMLLQARDVSLRNPAQAVALAQRAFALRNGTDASALELVGEGLAAQKRESEASNAFRQAAAVWRALGQPARGDAADARARSLAEKGAGPGG